MSSAPISVVVSIPLFFFSFLPKQSSFDFSSTAAFKAHSSLFCGLVPTSLSLPLHPTRPLAFASSPAFGARAGGTAEMWQKLEESVGRGGKSPLPSLVQMKVSPPNTEGRERERVFGLSFFRRPFSPRSSALGSEAQRGPPLSFPRWHRRLLPLFDSINLPAAATLTPTTMLVAKN